MICLIDNYDSFTYNIVHLLEKIGNKVVVLKNDCTIHDILNTKPTHIVISPGPGNPQESGICFEVVGYFKDKLPILGICLGHQIIAKYFGSQVSYAKHVMHGKKSLITNNGMGLFKGLPRQFYVARYHSLAIAQISQELSITATDTTDSEIMAIQHKILPIFGVQFHPESFLSEYGSQLLYNFICM